MEATLYMLHDAAVLIMRYAESLAPIGFPCGPHRPACQNMWMFCCLFPTSLYAACWPFKIQRWPWSYVMGASFYLRECMGKITETKSLMLKCQAVASSVSLSSEISHLFSQIIRKIVSGYKFKCSLDTCVLCFGKGFEELALNLWKKDYVFRLLDGSKMNHFYMLSSENMWLISHKISPSFANQSKKITKIPQKQLSHHTPVMSGRMVT